MIAYLDTSVVLRRMLNHPEAVSDWGQWEAPYSSDLLRVEFFRTIDRYRLEGKLTDAEVARLAEEFAGFWEDLGHVGITPALLQRAAQSFPVAVRTLDALHLATAEAIGEELREGIVFYTHDARQSLAARAMGFAIRGLP